MNEYNHDATIVPDIPCHVKCDRCGGRFADNPEGRQGHHDGRVAPSSYNNARAMGLEGYGDVTWCDVCYGEFHEAMTEWLAGGRSVVLSTVRR